MINLKKFNPQTIIKSALMILKGVAVKVIKFVPCLGRGGTPWVHYEDKQGKRYATFLKKSDFEGYKWNDTYSEVTKLETGDSYKVSEVSCSCPDWEKRVKPGKKAACKHQLMRQDLMKEAGIIDLTNIPPCTRLEKKRGIFESDRAYNIYCKSKEFNREGLIIKDKMIGYITIDKNIVAWRSSAHWGKQFDNIMDAINYLLWSHDLSFNKWRECYEDKYNPEVFPEEIQENIDDNFDPFGGFNEDLDNSHEDELNLDPFGGFSLAFN